MKSDELKCFLLIKTTARASPIARSAVVLAVGASPRGQASFSTPTSITISLYRAKVDLRFPVKAITLHPILRMLGTSKFSSSVSPLLERASNTSSGLTMPRSPCIASTGCKNKERVPVLFKVATIFLPTIPDFPIPLTISLPLVQQIKSTMVLKWLSTRSTSFKMPSASIFRTSIACSMTDIIIKFRCHYILNKLS